MDYPTVEDFVGNTPLCRLQRLCSNPSNTILCKLEGNNPAGSVKDRCGRCLGGACTCGLHVACYLSK
jgi:cysteine synthase